MIRMKCWRTKRQTGEKSRNGSLLNRDSSSAQTALTMSLCAFSILTIVPQSGLLFVQYLFQRLDYKHDKIQSIIKDKGRVSLAVD
ncbi:unnamed protein product [Nezara viridula]|uniref:Uncharacterized protein n=1 Tax=Nezara viridula TaxID=85310 RepID=A0A9P0H3U4_NEZVI|nr:unnamed protein product [Nezara viridula]